MFIISKILDFKNQTAWIIMCGSRGETSGPDSSFPLENPKVIEFPIIIGPDHMENHKAPKPVLNVGPPSARK